MNHYDAQTSNMKHNTTSMTHNEICYAFYETQSHYYDSQGPCLLYKSLRINYFKNHYKGQKSNMKHKATAMTHNKVRYESL